MSMSDAFFDQLQALLDEGVGVAREVPTVSVALGVVSIAVFLNGVGFSAAATFYALRACAERLWARRALKRKGERVCLQEGEEKGPSAADEAVAEMEAVEID